MSSPVLVVAGTAPSGGSGADLIVDADSVFAFPGEPESVALFYAEVWRVERVAPCDAVGRITTWARSGPAGDGLLLVPGDPSGDVALRSVLDGLACTAPGLDVRVPAGARIAPPFRSPLFG